MNTTKFMNYLYWKMKACYLAPCLMTEWNHAVWAEGFEMRWKTTKARNIRNFLWRHGPQDPSESDVARRYSSGGPDPNTNRWTLGWSVEYFIARNLCRWTRVGGLTVTVGPCEWFGFQESVCVHKSRDRSDAWWSCERDVVQMAGVLPPYALLDWLRDNKEFYK